MCCTSKNVTDTEDWCTQNIRAEFSELQEIETKSTWFKVYVAGKDVYAIAEHFNYEEVISYLILGTERALLFDTGNGFDSMYTLVKELTDLPVTVINSHTHYDHIGSNYEFDHILAYEKEYTMYWAENGWSHDLVKDEVAPDAFCHKMLPDFDTSAHHIRPFNISEFIMDGHMVELGDRSIEVLSVPGHTPDGITLLDRKHGYLWTGDVFYEATIWLFFDGTDLDAYKESIAKLADLTPQLTKVFPAHNKPIAKPERLVELVGAFDQILSGAKKPKENDQYGLPVYDGEEKVIYEFENFSFLIRKDLLNSRAKM